MMRAPTLTQEALANLMGVSRASVNLIEQGHRFPTRDFVRRAVNALDLLEPDAPLLWKAAGFVPPSAPIPLNALATRSDVEQALPSSDQNPILAYLAYADVLALVDGWRLLAEADKSIRDGHYDHARTVCAGLVDRRHATPSLRIFARRKLAEANRLLGDLHEAEQNLAPEAVESDLPEEDTSSLAAFLRALITGQRGEVALRRGRYEQGLSEFEASQDGYGAVLENSPNETATVIHLGRGMAFERMAKAALFLGDERQAEGYCDAADLHLDNAAPSPQRSELRRKVVELRAWGLARKGEFQSAIKLHVQARDSADKAGDIRGVLKNCVYLGDDWRRRAEQAVEGNRRDEPGAFYPRPPREAYIAAQEATHGEIDEWVREARSAYEAAMRYMKEHPAPYMMGLCLRNLGIIARFQSKFAEADTLLRQAQRFDEDMKLTGRLPAIYEARGDLYWGQGMREQAIKWYTRALDALDELASAANDSSRPSLPPDEQRESRVHANERVRVSASLEALRSLSDAQQSLDRGRPDRSEVLDQQWHEATTALKECISDAINRGRGELIATSDSDLKWIRELADFEKIPGSRLLAQNSLSAGWSDALSDEFTAQPHTNAEITTASDAFRRRRASIRRYASAGYRDLATESAVLSDLETPAGRTRAQNALAIMEQSHDSYTLTLTRLPVPIAFTVKGARVLAEAPRDLLSAIQSTEMSSQAMLNPSQTTEKEAIWCYRFDDAALAHDLTAIFDHLEEIAIKQGGDDAATALRLVLSAKRERPSGSGV
jgi:tetratricopeptide (TPR) repeat protein